MSPTEKTQRRQAFQLKGSLFTITVLQLNTSDLTTLIKELKQTIALTPKFFAQAPLILDVSKIKTDIDFSDLRTRLASLTIIPIGIRGGNTAIQNAAKKAGLAVFHDSKPDAKQKPSLHKPEKPVKKAVTPKKVVNKIIQKAIRSGQQVSATEGDLIIVNSVNEGTELLAAGNIHVYGTLRGRVLAGIHGDTNARIFCRRLDAQLVSIAGHYLLDEHLKSLPTDAPVQIYLQGEQLKVKAL